MVLERDLAGPIGLFVNFSTLQDYGVDKVFYLENGNADTSQRNVVFIARGEVARHSQSIAGMYVLTTYILSYLLVNLLAETWGPKVGFTDHNPLCSVSLGSNSDRKGNTVL